MSSVLTRIVAGGSGRKTRLHTEQGKLIDLSEAIVDIPDALKIKLSTIMTGRRPDVPWWPVRAIPLIEQRLGQGSKVLEFGSGSSTIWLARRSAHVFAIEDNPLWAQKTKQICIEKKITNTTIIQRDNSNYWYVPDDLDHIDLAVIDGKFRWRCLEQILPYMRSGSTIYLDNADSDKDHGSYIDTSSSRLAQKRILELIDTRFFKKLSKIRSITHGEFSASEGWIIDV